MAFIPSWLLGFGLLGGALVALDSAERKHHTVRDSNTLPTWLFILVAALFFGVGCFMSLVVVSLIWHWPIRGLYHS